jgi:hypothetical protein
MDQTSIATPLVLDPVCRDIYQGTFAADELLSKPTKFPAGFILNSDRSDGVGKHWYAMFVWKRKSPYARGTAEIFDSLGIREPSLPHALRASLADWNIGRVIRTQGVYQHPTLSKACGAFAIFFIRMRCHGYPLERVLNELTPGEYFTNERIVKTLGPYTPCHLDRRWKN